MNQIDRLLRQVARKKQMAMRHGDAVIQMRCGFSWTTRTVQLVDEYVNFGGGDDA